MQRAILLGCLGSVVLVAVLAVWLRLWATGLLADVKASPVCQGVLGLAGEDCSTALFDTYARIQSKQSLLHMAAAVVTCGAGVVLGVSAFARDFEQRTQVLLLTQGVSRARWWLTKCVLTVVPWALTTTALGAIFTWALQPIRQYSAPMDIDRFYLSALGLLVLGTLSVCLGVTVGILVRSALGAILLAGFLVAVAVAGAEAARPYLVATDRIVSEAHLGTFYGPDPTDAWWQRAGYLDASGQEVVPTADCDDLYRSTTMATTQAEPERLSAQCLARSGVVASFTDVIPAARFPMIRTLWAGGLLVVCLLVLAIGFLRLRRRVL